MSYDDSKPMVGSYRPKSRRCCIVSVLSVGLAIILILAIAIPVGMKNAKNAQAKPLQGQEAINAACAATSYPETCNQTLSGAKSDDPMSLIKVALIACENQLNLTLDVVKTAAASPNANVSAAATVCETVLEDAYDQVEVTLTQLNANDSAALSASLGTIQTILSAALEDHQTCLAAFQEVAPTSTESNNLQSMGTTTDAMLSNALALINAFAEFGDKLAGWKNTIFSLPNGLNLTQVAQGLFGNRRRLLSENLEVKTNIFEMDGDTPTWVDGETRRHLLSERHELSGVYYNVKVAADGSGNYRTIMGAINNMPHNSNKRYTIYVKAGLYNEQVVITKNQINLVLFGDGQGKTVLTGHRSVALTRGMTTFLSPTLIVGGAGFIGKWFTVQNTAGSFGQQACAVRVSADRVAFYMVTMDSFQDTLYAHTFRQFYTVCTIQGTVDFIFGNGNAVFQGSTIVAKRSTLIGQQNTYTAQGRTDPHQNTGVSFQNCNFVGTAQLLLDTYHFPTYLGRPWKQYSVCVHLKSHLGGHISPQGWLPWNTTNFGLYTSFFAEYQSWGPGANVRARVKWSHQITDVNQANHYQAGEFISAYQWLPQLGVPYTMSSV